MIEVDWKLNLSPESFILFLQTQCFFTGLVTEPRLLQKTLYPDMLRINKNYLSLRQQQNERLQKYSQFHNLSNLQTPEVQKNVYLCDDRLIIVSGDLFHQNNFLVNSGLSSTLKCILLLIHYGIYGYAPKSQKERKKEKSVQHTFPKSFFSFPFLNEKKGQILEFELKNLL